MIDLTRIRSQVRQPGSHPRGIETDADADAQCLLATILLTGLAMLLVVLGVANLASIAFV
jgi:hypothetical protein